MAGIIRRETQVLKICFLLAALSIKTLTSGWTVIKEIWASPPPSRVFWALTVSNQIDKWFTNGAKVDLRVGGKYSNGDGDKGRFLEIVRNQRLRFSWDNPDCAPECIVEILLKRTGNRTLGNSHSLWVQERMRTLALCIE